MNPICLLCRAAKSIRPDPIWKISSSDPIRLLTKPIRCIFANLIRLWSDRSKPDPIWKSDRVGLKIKKNKINETKWQTKQTIKQILDLNEKNMWTHTRTHTTRSYTKRARASEIGDGETPNSNRTKQQQAITDATTRSQAIAATAKRQFDLLQLDCYCLLSFASPR